MTNSYLDIDPCFLRSIYTDDIIYHYTKASIAIDYILYTNELLFQQAHKSNDPIERRKVDRGVISFNVGDDGTKNYEIEQQLLNFVSDVEGKFQQICFCKNRMGEDFGSENYSSNFEGNEELFGFAKPRMWDQYADKFSGVCIAFSKEKILSKNRQKFEIIDDDVRYLTFQELLKNKIGDIQADYLKNIGEERYKQELHKRIRKSFFYKHTDYSGETEYRIGALFDEEKCSADIVRGEMLNNSMKLDISGCIKAIFVSSYANERQKKDLLEYANKLNVEMIEMDWQYNTFSPIDYKRLKSRLFVE